MELPILYALSHPERVADATLRTFDPVAASPLTFEEVDRDAFRLFGLGVGAGRRGGTAPAVFNAANEAAVEAFQDRRIGFGRIVELIQHVLERHDVQQDPDLKTLLAADAWARREVTECLKT